MWNKNDEHFKDKCRAALAGETKIPQADSREVLFKNKGSGILKLPLSATRHLSEHRCMCSAIQWCKKETEQKSYR